MVGGLGEAFFDALVAHGDGGGGGPWFTQVLVVQLVTQKLLHCVHSRLGSADSVPALAALLPDADLSHMGRYALEVLPPPFADANPDLLLRHADGSACVEAQDRTCGCIYGPMLDRIILPQLTEIAALYPVDGIFLDGLPMAFWNPCHCAACKTAPRALSRTFSTT